MTKGGHSATATVSRPLDASSLLEGKAVVAMDKAATARTSLSIKNVGLFERNLRIGFSYPDEMADKPKSTHACDGLSPLGF